jgi:hypothetical protein
LVGFTTGFGSCLNIISYDVLLILGDYLLKSGELANLMSIFYCKSIFRVGGFCLGIGCALPSLFTIFSFGDFGVFGLGGGTDICD